MSPVLTAVVLVLAPAADPVTVSFPKLEKGQKFSVEFKRSHDLTIGTVIGGKGDTVKDTMAPTWDYTETIDEVGKDGTPTKVRRAFGKAEALVAKQTKGMPFQNAEVLFEKGDKFWTVKVATGAPLTGIEHRLAVADFDELPPASLAFFTPEKPVAVGSTWQPDKKAALAYYAHGDYMTFDAAKAKVSSQLVKAYEQGGKRFGVITFTLDAPILTMKGKDVFVGENGSRLRVEAKFDGCIDGTERRFTRTSTVKMHFSASTEFQNQTVQISSAAEITQTDVVRPAGK